MYLFADVPAPLLSDPVDTLSSVPAPGPPASEGGSSGLSAAIGGGAAALVLLVAALAALAYILLSRRKRRSAARMSGIHGDAMKPSATVSAPSHVYMKIAKKNNL